MNELIRAIRSFAVEDDGVQVVEYALIIAVVAIGLTIALGGMNNSSFATFTARVNTCLTTSACI